MTTFSLSQRNFWPGCQEIDIAGELDLAVSDELRAALDRAVANCLHVLVDLSACEFIDLSGIETLVHGHLSLSARGRQLLLYGAAGQVQRVLAVTDLVGVNHGPLVAAQTQVLAAA